ncbi:MAG: proline--tRNA ligase [Armatimonadetes bacterium]|nr:proline--tRNA ligase [Armatimonadota bacterium]
MSQTAITPTRADDYPEWYQAVIRAADLAEASPVRGCMVIKPWGYALWENIQRSLDAMLKATGHVNAYFPLFIPLSYLEQEAQHVEGFAKECAVVTHHRLTAIDGRLQPDGELEMPLVVRPTSETIIGAAYAKWIQSYRDLPVLINQWANVVRWELRPRLFLRTTEFLWQEGHTAHETESEAIEETLQMLEVYRSFAEDYLAIPVLTGEKSPGERFPGAVSTYCIEAMMQDRKALQAGTSHFLGQNFAQASGIKFQSREGVEEYAWTTSWGVSTRLVGGLIMTHGDDNGLILPPRLAPQQVVILPILRKDEDRETVLPYCESLADDLRAQQYDGRPVSVLIDRRELNAGEKGWDWIKKGAPVVAEVGPRDLTNNAVFVGRRDRDRKERVNLGREEFVSSLAGMLDQIQRGLFSRAQAFRDANMREIDEAAEFAAFFTPQNAEKPEIHGGFALSRWCGEAACEAQANDELSVSIRCIPFDSREHGEGPCIACGKPATQRVVFAKAY